MCIPLLVKNITRIIIAGGGLIITGGLSTVCPSYIWLPYPPKVKYFQLPGRLNAGPTSILPRYRILTITDQMVFEPP